MAGRSGDLRLQRTNLLAPGGSRLDRADIDLQFRRVRFVGQASGRAVRASLVMIMVVDLTLTVMLWGLQPVFVFKG